MVKSGTKQRTVLKYMAVAFLKSSLLITTVQNIRSVHRKMQLGLGSDHYEQMDAC